ncbi:unnamed protein product [Schistosoma curassoni]|uniref:FERM domain-containing protein n=1 Tax=Schistosoma curassoni TaxID=6186 RepID=A0A183K6C0_9TREM|nr:unnamed protein product [Schistosoma curassoni]
MRGKHSNCDEGINTENTVQVKQTGPTAQKLEMEFRSPRSPGHELYTMVVEHLQLVEYDYFDLEYINKDGLHCWLDHSKAINKQINISKRFLYSFVVKFYTPHPNLLEDELTRYLFALQIKIDLRSGRLQCSESTAALLAAFIVQGTVTTNATVYLTKKPALDLMGLDLIETLKLADHSINSFCRRVSTDDTSEWSQKNAVLQRHHNVFKEGLGECTKVNALLTLKPAATPVFRPKRPVPYAALPIVEQELQWIQEMGVIEPVNFSNWAAPIVVVKKSDGSVRLCADYSIGLSEALESHQYPGMAERLIR